jgi:histone H3/H4
MTSQIDLPISITYEIIKSCLDSDVLLSKNTKVAFSRIGGVFIMYISHLANEICKSRGRSKITINDITEALEKAGFEDFNAEVLSSVNSYEDSLKNQKKADEEPEENLIEDHELEVKK